MSRTEIDSHIESALGQLARVRTDEDAWSILYRSLWPLVISTTYRELRGSGQEAQDAAQEVFKRLVMYCPFEKFSSALSFKGYVRTVSINVARDVRAVASSEVARFTETDAQGLSRGRSPEQEELVAAKQMQRRIAALLTADDRKLLDLIAQGHSLREVARRMSLTYTAAGVRLFRLRTRLREDLRRDRSLTGTVG
jgi:RNA polymerase sigma factor (sigma-70 family)